MADIEVELDDRSRAKLKRAAGVFRDQLADSLDAELKTTANRMADAMQSAVRGIPSRGRGRTFGSHNARAQIAAGLGVERLTGDGSGAQIRSAPRLPANRAAMAAALNRHTWRHPVFAQVGRARVMVTQRGEPYIAPVIARFEKDARAAAEKALDRAVDAVDKG